MTTVLLDCNQSCHVIHYRYAYLYLLTVSAFASCLSVCNSACANVVVLPTLSSRDHHCSVSACCGRSQQLSLNSYLAILLLLRRTPPSLRHRVTSSQHLHATLWPCHVIQSWDHPGVTTVTVKQRHVIVRRHVVGAGNQVAGVTSLLAVT